MPHYLAIGVSWERIMDSCPKELEPYDIAHRKKLEEQDYLQYMWWGNYGLSAVAVAVEHTIFGKKAKSEYVKEAILSNAFENEEQTYERELKKALLAEEQWIIAGKQRGLPETII